VIAFAFLHLSCSENGDLGNESTATNHPPEITSTPVTEIDHDQPYEYIVRASDPDGDVLSFSLAHAPWLSFDEPARSLTGQPTLQDTGSFDTKITVSDGQDSVQQDFAIMVSKAANASPFFVSSPVMTADHNREYVYTASATDPDGDPLIFSAIHPSWLGFDAGTATISGLATRDNLGVTSITISVTDGDFEVSQNYTISVVVGEIICDTDFGDPGTSLYIIPFPAGSSYSVTQSYCNPFGGHNNTFAYDFHLSIGDTVVASRPGTVLFTNDQYLDGDIISGHENNVFITHDDGTVIRYTHLMHNGALVSAGEEIVEGQAIALSGNTGNTGNVPHLHFALFRDNTDYGGKNTLPVNYRNADGPLDQNNGLIQGESYSAVPF